ncbi:MAG: hypothetical protein ABWY55_06655 [Microbacterium sp.]
MTARGVEPVSPAAELAQSEAPRESLTTFAPVIERAERFQPTGNLVVALPELDESGVCRSVNVLSETERGVVAAVGDILAPVVEVDGVRVEPRFSWDREADWMPVAVASSATGAVEARWVAPVSRGGTSDAGFAARLVYRNSSDRPQDVRLAWTGEWATTVVHHFRAKELALTLRTRDDAWTGCRAVYAGAERLLFSLSWRPGEGGAFADEQPEHGWTCERAASLAAGETLTLDVHVGVATEPDGSGGTALYLRRTGFDALRAETASWLEHHGPRFDASAAAVNAELEPVVRRNAFFSHFYAQADCLDTGRVVMHTSRSPRYYVSGAFWSRDSYWWNFPALLLVDPVRARRALLASLDAAGSNVAHHALYITGQRLYPGFELDELVAPVLAVWRYVDATADRSVLAESPIRRLLETVSRELDEMSVQLEGLFEEAFVTTLLPTDDPTEFPITATGNALVAVALEAIGRLTDDPDASARGRALRARLAGMFVREPEPGRPRRWAWAIDHDGRAEWRDEPPLGLRLLPYLGVDADDAIAETSRWLVTDYPFHYDGPFPGAGAPHFASPSSFDLGNRMLTGDTSLGDPRQQLVETPMDNGLGCESWDPETGIVVTGQAMASVAGYLAWTAWADAARHRRWDDHFPLPEPASAGSARSTSAGPGDETNGGER